jgi:peptide/nickel transport system substrate-binding protein
MNMTSGRLGRSLLLAMLGLCVGAQLLSGCSQTSKASVGNETSAAASASTLRIAFYSDNPILVSLDPFQVYWIEHRVVLRNVAESLTDQDPVTGKIIPWLATSWQISPDGLQYTFVLRDGVTFSNGKPFNAQAVKTAFDADKAFVAAAPATFGATYLQGYDHADVVDDHTVRIVLSHPNAGFLQATSTTNLAILAPESYALTPQQRSHGAIVGTGPFVLANYTPEVGITLTRRKGYAWASSAASNRGEACVDIIDISYVPEESVRNGQFIQGQVDIVWPRNPFADVDLKQFRAAGATIQSRALPGPAANLYPNVSPGRVLSDPRVRLALQKSIDRASYAATIYNKDFPVVASLYDSTTPYFKPLAPKLAYDPQGAAKLLDDAGWKLGADGLRHKDGKPLTLVRNLLAETSGDILVQDQLRHAGIDLKLNILVAGEFTAANAAGHYDLSASYMTRGDPAVLQTFLDPRFTNRSALSANAYAPQTLERAEKLFDAGSLTTDSAQRAKAYGELQDLLIDEGVAFPVYERLWQAATSKRVEGFRWTSEGFALFNDIKLKS